MPADNSGSRVLIYSHDTFGLGHLRRCRTIAHTLVENFSNLSVLIISGSPIIGSFDFRARVDFVRVPGVIKLRSGEYTSLNLHLDIEDTLRLRQSIIQHTAEIFAPDLFIVDKEPLGLRGEVAGTLDVLRKQGTRLVVGFRDILDDPDALAAEWQRKQAMPALRDIYDEIWIYGLPQIHEPLAGLDTPAHVIDKISYTGYLCAPAPAGPAAMHWPKVTQSPYILVTTGGGGDGEGLIDWVLSTYELCMNSREKPPLPALLILGPFMSRDAQNGFMTRAEKLPHVDTLMFESHIEQFETHAAAIVAMGGYNTFCDILSHDKPALVVPRTVPRMEQAIRAERAFELGLIDMLHDPVDQGAKVRDPQIMLNALRRLPGRPPPSHARIANLCDGRGHVADLAEPWIVPGARRVTAPSRSGRIKRP